MAVGRTDRAGGKGGVLNWATWTGRLATQLNQLRGGGRLVAPVGFEPSAIACRPAGKRGARRRGCPTLQPGCGWNNRHNPMLQHNLRPATAWRVAAMAHR